MAPKGKRGRPSATAAAATTLVSPDGAHQEAGTPPKNEKGQKRLMTASSEQEVKPAKMPSILMMLKKTATPARAEERVLPVAETPVPPPQAEAVPESTECVQNSHSPLKEAEAIITPPKKSSERKRPAPKAEKSEKSAAAKRGKKSEDVPSAASPAEAPASTTDVASAPAVEKDSSLSQVMDLKLGSLNYSCLCTKDPAAASEWAASVPAGSEDSEDAAALIGLDCEWSPPWHRAPGAPDRLATLQLFHFGSSGRRALVFSVAGLEGKLPEAVAELLSNARVAKVGVNIAGDASRLVRDFGIPVRGLYDLSNLNKVDGKKMRKSISLEDLVDQHCPEDFRITKSDAALEKGVRTGNWETWPLSAEQIDYAAKDAALGVMAFTCKFGMLQDDHLMSKEALEALAKLDEVTSDTVAASKAASKKKQEKSTDAKNEESGDTEKKDQKDNKQNFFVAMRNSVLKAPNIGKKEHPDGPCDALKGVCIIVSGVLDSFERADMEAYVKKHGGTVSKSVTAKVTHLVTDHGEAGPSKLAKCKELGTPCVSEDVILKMVSDAIAKA